MAAAAFSLYPPFAAAQAPGLGRAPLSPSLRSVARSHAVAPGRALGAPHVAGPGAPLAPPLRGLRVRRVPLGCACALSRVARARRFRAFVVGVCCGCSVVRLRAVRRRVARLGAACAPVLSFCPASLLPRWRLRRCRSRCLPRLGALWRRCPRVSSVRPASPLGLPSLWGAGLRSALSRLRCLPLWLCGRSSCGAASPPRPGFARARPLFRRCPYLELRLRRPYPIPPLLRLSRSPLPSQTLVFGFFLPRPGWLLSVPRQPGKLVRLV